MRVHGALPDRVILRLCADSVYHGNHTTVCKNVRDNTVNDHFTGGVFVRVIPRRVGVKYGNGCTCGNTVLTVTVFSSVPRYYLTIPA